MRRDCDGDLPVKRRGRILAGLAAVVLLAMFGAVSATAQVQAPASAPLGIAAKRPVFGGACKVCPWGAVGEIVKAAMQPYGYDVQICYHCWQADAPRIVAEARRPPPWRTGMAPGIIVDSDIPPPPDGPVDFGATSVNALLSAYRGTGGYAADGPFRNLRLIANIQAPNYMIIAATRESGITNLAQLRNRQAPLRVLADNRYASPVLAHYGLTREAIEASGGKVASSTQPAERRDFDLVIAGGSLANAPEFNVWYEVSQTHDLVYLRAPEDLLSELAEGDGVERGVIPNGLLRGLHEPIPTVVRTGHAVYARDDTPDEFAYAVARALDEQQQLFQWSHINLSYNVRTVWKADEVPLHPGAERYYRERGYVDPA
jgi:TRAP transporter TAXI family solute receptor